LAIITQNIHTQIGDRPERAVNITSGSATINGGLTESSGVFYYLQLYDKTGWCAAHVI
jgi:hypothetical protein